MDQAAKQEIATIHLGGASQFDHTKGRAHGLLGAPSALHCWQLKTSGQQRGISWELRMHESYLLGTTSAEESRALRAQVEEHIAWANFENEAQDQVASLVSLEPRLEPEQGPPPVRTRAVTMPPLPPAELMPPPPPADLLPHRGALGFSTSMDWGQESPIFSVSEEVAPAVETSRLLAELFRDASSPAPAAAAAPPGPYSGRQRAATVVERPRDELPAGARAKAGLGSRTEAL